MLETTSVPGIREFIVSSLLLSVSFDKLLEELVGLYVESLVWLWVDSPSLTTSFERSFWDPFDMLRSRFAGANLFSEWVLDDAASSVSEGVFVGLALRLF